ncbi:MAG: Ig-like domain repeat protein [Ahniella sp.]|nr:Ig-like domain repeat protein [Ahniella sp.]
MKSRIIAGIALALFGLGAAALEPGKGFGAAPRASGVLPKQAGPILLDRNPLARSLTDAVEANKIIAGSGNGAADDRFGRSLSMAGNLLAIGSPTDDSGILADAGSVYVFQYTGSAWVFQAKINPPVPEQNGAFGAAVAIIEDRLAIGSPLATTADGATSGAVYIYRLNGNTWALEQNIDPAARSANDNFGSSLAIDSTNLVAGARTGDASAASAGSVWVFTRSGTIWSEQQRLTANDGATADNFGLSVALSGNSVIVGANLARISALEAAGAAYVFTRSGSIWTQQQKLVAPVAGELDEFGVDVDLEGDTAIVGHRNEDGTFANSGAARIYTRAAGVWTLTTTLTASDAADNDFFGLTVALDGPFALVGAYTEDRTGLIDAGAAYIYERSQGGVWSQKDKFIASDAANIDQFGFEVALAPGLGLVGAPLDDNSDGIDAGAVYTFVNGTPTTTALVTNLSSLTYGETLSLLATVTPTATGTVNFNNGVSLLGADVLDGASQGNLNLVPNAGSYAVSAAYLGDGTNLASTSNVANVSVSRAATNLALNGSHVTREYGQTVSFTATLTESAVGGVSPGGNIVFNNNGNFLASVPLSGGQAVLSRNNLPVGSYNITAVYAGDTNFLGASSASVPYSVTVANVSISVTSSPNPAPRNTNQTFTATFTGGIPTGNVALQALPQPTGSPIALGSPAIVSGVASIQSSVLPLGSYIIRAIYVGDANHAFNQSDSVQTHVVTAAADLSIVKSNGITFINEGSQVTYTITVSNPAGGDPVVDARVNDNVNAAFFDDSILETSWTCAAGAGANCDTLSGNGDIVNLLVDLDPGSSVVITLTTRCRAEGNEFTVTNTATVSAPVGLTDTNPANNSSTDADQSGMFRDGFEG